MIGNRRWPAFFQRPKRVWGSPVHLYLLRAQCTHHTPDSLAHLCFACPCCVCKISKGIVLRPELLPCSGRVLTFSDILNIF